MCESSPVVDAQIEGFLAGGPHAVVGASRDRRRADRERGCASQPRRVPRAASAGRIDEEQVYYAIAFELVDDTGTVLRELGRCDIDDLYADASEPYRLRTLQLLDFGNAQGQLDNSWPSSDIGNRERTFRYGLTQLTLDEQGQCDALTDSEGFVDIADATQWIEIRGTMWDVRDNATPFEVRLSRTVVVDPPPDPDPAPDPWTGLVESVELPQGGQHYTATPIVPPGTYRFAIEGTGDGDLYVRVADAPTLDEFDCRPYQWGSQEECTVVLDEPAPIHAMVYGYEDCAVTLRGAPAP
jgi:hypothetical protein